ncbi:MAG: DUF1013 domain-containing protein [Bosea sp. (in: a-proteobacteria)]
MTDAPLMPKATAVWLVENTSLTFDQIAEFCKLHPLEVKGIADGEVATGIKGFDPVTNGQLTREELDRAQRNAEHKLKLAARKVIVPEMKRTKGPRYTPVSKRHDRPNAILWLTRNHPELKDAQIIRLVGTTKATIAQIKERAHWNSAQLQPVDPVSLGLCTQIDLDFEVGRAAKSRPQPELGAVLLSTEQSLAPEPVPEVDVQDRPQSSFDADTVFAKLKQLKRDDADEDGDEAR